MNYTIDDAREFVSSNRPAQEKQSLQMHHKIQYLIEHMLTNAKFIEEKLNGWQEVANCIFENKDKDELIRMLRAGGWHVKLSGSGRSVAISFPQIIPRPEKNITEEDYQWMTKKMNEMCRDK